jgi:cellulose biosynthesis protein BcsQ
MIVALLSQRGNVGKTTPAPHFASHSSRQGKRSR